MRYLKDLDKFIENKQLQRFYIDYEEEREALINLLHRYDFKEENGVYRCPNGKFSAKVSKYNIRFDYDNGGAEGMSNYEIERIDDFIKKNIMNSIGYNDD
jgi:hypothetical protein